MNITRPEPSPNLCLVVGGCRAIIGPTTAPSTTHPRRPLCSLDYSASLLNLLNKHSPSFQLTLSWSASGFWLCN
ncbi:hypothetical protein J4Q44_G00228920, partial [Coregonus suidteri]